MITKNTRVNKNPIVGTDFQLHKTQLSVFSGLQHKTIDFTEHRLLKCIFEADDKARKIALEELLIKYRRGHVAISWRSGNPHWLNVTKDSLCTGQVQVLQLEYAY